MIRVDPAMSDSLVAKTNAGQAKREKVPAAAWSHYRSIQGSLRDHRQMVIEMISGEGAAKHRLAPGVRMRSGKSRSGVREPAKFVPAVPASASSPAPTETGFWAVAQSGDGPCARPRRKERINRS